MDHVNKISTKENKDSWGQEIPQPVEMPAVPTWVPVDQDRTEADTDTEIERRQP